MPFKIIKLKADNYKTLKAIEIDANGNAVEIRGKNGQGKTTVLDAIQETLRGKVAKNPIRNGEDSAKIVLEIGSDKTQYIATRTFTEKGSYLKVENTDGFKTTSPQKILDTLIGELSFDPIAFSNMDAKRRRETILSICPELNVEDLDADHAAEYDERTYLNRKFKEVESLLNSLKSEDIPEDLPAQEISAADIIKSRDADLEDIKVLQNKALELAESAAENARQIEDSKTGIIEAKKAIETLEDQIRAKKSYIRQLESFINLSEKKNFDPEIGEIENEIVKFKGRADQKTAQLERLESINRFVRLNDQVENKTAELAAIRADIEAKNARLKSIEQKKADRFKNAVLPVPGLALTPDGVTVNGTPFEDLATSERLRVSFAVAMALNPRIRVVFIRDGSLLDPESLSEVYRMAKENDFQVWVEVTTADENIGFIIKE